ncbi:MAG: hypothetical protein KAQ96_12240 [Thermoplasmata archaeon]|nr:hypothetical protein [Thermoplasmata archaeon]
MNGRDILIAILVALALATASSSVHAHEDSHTDTLEFLEHVAVEIDATDGSSTKVTWDIKVTEGVPVNVFLMPEEGYDDYIDPLKWKFSYYLAHSKNNTESFKKTVVLNDNIVYYLVIENTGYSSMDNSTVEYEVTWDETSGLFGPWCWALIIILIILGGLGFTIWRRRQGSGSGSEGPMEEPAPGTTTYTAPEEEETSEDALVYEGPETEYPDPAEGETWGGAQVHESMEPIDTDATELSPQPEPPDMPSEGGDSGYRGTPEEPAPGTGVYHPPGEGAAELSPQPEPPDMPGDTMRPTGDGVSELSPQPEPPDLEARTETLRPTGEDATKLSPQPEPPDHPLREGKPPEPDSGHELPKKGKPTLEPEGDGPTGEPL